MRVRQLSVGIALIVATVLAGAGPIHASPSPRSQEPISGERYITAKVNGAETRYLAPARNDRELQAQIDAHLKRAPGGVQINKNEIAYNNGKFIMTFALPGQVEGTDPSRVASSDFSVQSNRCQANWYCFFDGVNFTYPRGQLNDCGWQDLANWGWHDRTESIAQNLLSPYKVFYENHTTGGHGNDETIFWTDAGSDERSSVPYPNMADHASLWCP